MKYIVMLGDGMADLPIASLGKKTPLEAANKPMMDYLASKGINGIVDTVPEGMVPESDTANLAVMGYDPRIYSKGRSPLEAASMGIAMNDDETAIRANIVALGGDGEYEDLIMLDHSSDEIPTEEARVLIEAVQERFGNDFMRFYCGISYRHCLIWKDAPEKVEFMRPHDILGQKISGYLPPEPFLTLQKKSYDILSKHPVNLDRISRGLRPANSLWLWSPGKKPALPSFAQKWGLSGAVISAVDLIKGIGLCAGMRSIDVPGATGNVNTNYTGKADAAVKAFRDGTDFVYIHVEGPDECGHRAELDNKVTAIERIDREILRPVFDYLARCGEDYKIMILPDHPTPICTRTHAMDPVPFLIYDSANEKVSGVDCLDEENAASTGLYVENGYKLLDMMIVKGN